MNTESGSIENDDSPSQDEKNTEKNEIVFTFQGPRSMKDFVDGIAAKEGKSSGEVLYTMIQSRIPSEKSMEISERLDLIHHRYLEKLAQKRDSLAEEKLQKYDQAMQLLADVGLTPVFGKPIHATDLFER